MLYYKLQDFGKEKCARAVTIRDTFDFEFIIPITYACVRRAGCEQASGARTPDF